MFWSEKNNEVKETAVLTESDYFESRQPKKRVGSFKLYYEFQERRPEVNRYNGTSLSYNPSFSEGREAISRYSGYRQFILSDYVVKYGYDKSRNDYSPDLIRCPTCGAKGSIDHGWRVQCSSCDTWMESYGNSLETWCSVLRKKKTPFGIKYFHRNKKISEAEYNKLIVYYKLLGDTSFPEE